MNNNFQLARDLVVIVGDDNWLLQQIKAIYAENKSLQAVYIANKELLDFTNLIAIEAKNSHTILGQEFDYAMYNANVGLNLESLAMLAGTIKAGGKLYLFLNNWDKLAQQIDQDSLRWNTQNSAIATPNFYQYFQTKLIQAQVKLYSQLDYPSLIEVQKIQTTDILAKNNCFTPTKDQAQIINNIIDAESDIYVITAPRGRGKSALAGLLINHLRANNLLGKANIIVTAPNKNAVNILERHSSAEDFIFYAPDLLAQQIDQNPNQYANDWLIIDEAAMLPVAILVKLVAQFKHVVLTTTIHSYEGTGRGFILKFIKQLTRKVKLFNLEQPLRWQINDRLENCLNDLLLFSCEDEFKYLDYDPKLVVTSAMISQANLVQNYNYLKQFYALLTIAHYRTSPLDLRRLFDADNQYFWQLSTGEYLLGCAWCLAEGGIEDQTLIEEIWQGTRRPKGNLVPQLLCFQSNLKSACSLNSLRISRIAIQPKWQRQHQGANLIKTISEYAEQEQYDFVSTCFGYTDELALFWQECGFSIVRIGEHKEASSGCYSCVAIYPLSEAGIQFTQQALTQFKRDFNLTDHELITKFKLDINELELNSLDWQALYGFANFQRSLFSTKPALKRFLHQSNILSPDISQLKLLLQQIPPQLTKKQYLHQIRTLLTHILV